MFLLFDGGVDIIEFQVELPREDRSDPKSRWTESMDKSDQPVDHRPRCFTHSQSWWSAEFNDSSFSLILKAPKAFAVHSNMRLSIFNPESNKTNIVDIGLDFVEDEENCTVEVPMKAFVENCQDGTTGNFMGVFTKQPGSMIGKSGVDHASIQAQVHKGISMPPNLATPIETMFVKVANTTFEVPRELLLLRSEYFKKIFVPNSLDCPISLNMMGQISAQDFALFRNECLLKLRSNPEIRDACTLIRIGYLFVIPAIVERYVKLILERSIPDSIEERAEVLYAADQSSSKNLLHAVIATITSHEEADDMTVVRQISSVTWKLITKHLRNKKERAERNDSKAQSCPPKKQEPQETIKKVSLIQLFRYAEKMDIAMLLVGSLLAILTGMGMPLFSIVMGQVIQDFITATTEFKVATTPEELAIAKDHVSDAVILSCVQFAIVGGAIFIAASFQVSCYLTACERMTDKLRRDFVKAVVRQEPIGIAAFRGSAWFQKQFSNLERVREGTRDKVALFIQYTAQVIGGFVVAFASWQRQPRWKPRSTPAGGIAEKVLSSIRTVHAANAQPHGVHRYEEALHAGKLDGIKKSFYIGAGPACTIPILFASYCLAFWFGTEYVSWGWMEAGTLMTVFFAVMMGSMAVGQAGQQFAVIGAAQEAALPLHEVIDRVFTDMDQDPIESPRAEKSPRGGEVVSDPSKARNELARLKAELAEEGGLPIGFWSILKVARPEWFLILAALCSSAVFTLTDSDKLRTEGHFYALMFLALGAAHAVSMLISCICFGISSERLTMRLRLTSFRRLLFMNIALMDEPKNAPGKLCARLATDAPMVKAAIDYRLGQAVVVSACAGIEIGFYYGWQMTLIMLGIAPFAAIVLATQINDNAALESSRKVATEAMENVRTVQALTLEPNVVSRFNAHLDGSLDTATQRAVILGFSYGFSSSIFYLMYAATFGFGLWLILNNDTTPMNVIKVLFAISFTAGGLGTASAYFPEYTKATYAAGLIFKMMGFETNIEGMSEDEGANEEE